MRVVIADRLAIDYVLSPVEFLSAALRPAGASRLSTHEAPLGCVVTEESFAVAPERVGVLAQGPQPPTDKRGGRPAAAKYPEHGSHAA